MEFETEISNILLSEKDRYDVDMARDAEKEDVYKKILSAENTEG